MHSCLKDLASWLVVGAPVCTALLVAWIAWRQYCLGRDKLRLDLYQRRFSVYERTIAFYQAIIGPSDKLQADAFQSVHTDFIKSYRESQYLFEPDSGIFSILGELDEKAFKVISFKTMGIAQTAGLTPDVVIKMGKDSTDALAFYDQAIKRLERAIDPYLNFRRVLV